MELEKQIEKEKYQRRFIDHFQFSIELLALRLDKFKMISTKDLRENKTELFTYFDIIIVQLRAMFIENERYKTNYTFQNYLSLIGQEDKIEKITQYLNKPFIDENYTDKSGGVISIKTAIKILSDQYICHYDDTTYEEKSLVHLISTQLANIRNNSVYNIERIITNILDLTK